ncbi:MAG: hypothetical protein HQM14_05855 [SAR324 cluster bacterium]|nr:hypothetical protein [SAR324 cluster bacterium]
MVRHPFKIGITILFVIVLQGYVSHANALGQAFYFVSGKIGSQETGQPAPLIGKADQYLDTIKADHGNLKDDRTVTPIGFGFDFYRVDGALATGFGLELNRYSKSYSFADRSSVQLDVQGVLFAFSTYYRGEFLFPYLALGTGGYSVKIREKLVATSDEISTTNASFIDAAPSVSYYEIGSRFPFGEWGLLTSWRATSAQLKIQTIGKRLELGGQTIIFGVYYSY